MIFDLLQALPTDLPAADVCIVGGGAAGIVLAVELARQGKRVLLLEGGGGEVEELSQEPYRSELAGLPHNGIHVGRFRSAGGSTTRWGGQILELDALDFEQRPWIPGSGWPFAKQELQPFYERALTLEGLGSATLDDAQVWREIGQPAPHFADFETFFSRWCPETNFARLHGKTLAEHPLITVILHANAVTPLLEGTRITGLECRTFNGTTHTFTAAQFIWCMGGIESVRFFLQPPLSHLPFRQSGLLGKFFQDHLIAPAATLQPLDRKRFAADFANIFSRGYKYQPKLRLVRAQQEQHRTLNVAALIFFHSDSDAVGAGLKATIRKLLRRRFHELSGPELTGLIRHAPLLARQSWAYSVAHRAYIAPDTRIELGVHCEQPPTSASTVTLSAERDRLGMLRTRLDWQVSELELASIRTCVAVAAQSLAGVAHVLPDPELMTEAFRAKCGDGYHHMGGMRMAHSPADGVVDPNLKLHGMQNGYICSAAVFPSSGFSNPTHTVIALAVRLADHLARN